MPCVYSQWVLLPSVLCAETIMQVVCNMVRCRGGVVIQDLVAFVYQRMYDRCQVASYAGRFNNALGILEVWIAGKITL
jgi:hypothetical protein